MYQFSDHIFPLFIEFFVVAIIISLIELIPSIKCNNTNKWLTNPSLTSDVLYAIFNGLMYRYLFILITLLVWSFLIFYNNIDELISYIKNERGFFGGTPYYIQIPTYFIISDFFLYWLHRAFHTKLLWRFHSVHHEPKQVEWTTAYRFHLINLALGAVLTDVVMLYSGISPSVILLFKPIDKAFSYYVHANININLGPINNFFANPIFHRWHHNKDITISNKNYGARLVIWDKFFKTEYNNYSTHPDNYGNIK
jgi:sterol desaturase/sphingolipid hydroxylase (fatty acid hydroxylase superfamily)